MDDELEIEIAHRDAGPALAGRGLPNVAQPPAEFEIGALDRVLQQRAVDLLGHRIDEYGVALEFGEAKRGTQPFHHRVHEIGDDVLRMLEFDRREEVGIARDSAIAKYAASAFGSMGRPPTRSGPSDRADAQSVTRAPCGRGPEKPPPSNRFENRQRPSQTYLKFHRRSAAARSCVG